MNRLFFCSCHCRYDPDSLNRTTGERISYPSHSPFTLWEVGKSEQLDPPTDAQATLFLPDSASAENPVPARVAINRWR